jgi:hypothetical protein
MELRDSASAAQQFIRKLFGGSGPKRYAVEVDGTYAAAFDIPGTEIREYWENADHSVTFVLESADDLRAAAQKMQGVRSVSKM